jgi:integrase
MGRKNLLGVRRRKHGDSKSPLVFDFLYLNKDGVEARYRKVAPIQNWEAAVAEARRRMQRAQETGHPDGITSDNAETFAEFVDGDFTSLFMPSYRPSTRQRYEDLLRQSVRGFFGPTVLAKVDQKLIDRQFRTFAALLGKRGVQAKGAVNLARSIYNAAKEDGRIPTGIKFPRVFKEKKKLPACCTEAEYAVMLEAPGWLGDGAALAGEGGLRQGEVRALEVQDIDFVTNRISVVRAYSEEDVLETKNGDERAVDMTPYLAGRLRAAVKSKLPRARVILDEKGETPSRQEVLRRFKQYQRRQGAQRQWSFHSLRHRFCTMLARHGVHVEAVMQLAGHRSIATTMRYIHATEQDRVDAIRRLGVETERAVSGSNKSG